jgi:lipoyl(octanoyl) transferase
MRSERASDELWVCHLGTVPYSDGVAMQETIRSARQAGELPDTLLLLEHPPTYTYGRRASAQELALPEGFYAAQGIELHATDRGGRVTYHGPGQLVGYPIMAIEDVHRHLRTIEAAIVDALAQVGVDARSRSDEGIDYTGVWVATPQGTGERKIASIGVHVSRGVTTHGFAVNVDNDLQPFDWVVACGLPDVQMTSIAAERARTDARHADYDPAAPRPASATLRRAGGTGPAPACSPALDCFRKEVAYRFCQAHGRRQRLVSPARLGLRSLTPRPGRGRTATPPPIIKTSSPAPVTAVPA